MSTWLWWVKKVCKILKFVTFCQNLANPELLTTRFGIFVCYTACLLTFTRDFTALLLYSNPLWYLCKLKNTTDYRRKLICWSELWIRLWEPLTPWTRASWMAWCTTWKKKAGIALISDARELFAGMWRWATGSGIGASSSDASITTRIDRKGGLSMIDSPIKLRIDPREYRKPMSVTQWIRRSNSDYAVCPRCDTPMEYDHVGFCNRCGQRLSWPIPAKIKPRWSLHKAIPQLQSWGLKNFSSFFKNKAWLFK